MGRPTQKSGKIIRPTLRKRYSSKHTLFVNTSEQGLKQVRTYHEINHEWIKSLYKFIPYRVHPKSKSKCLSEDESQLVRFVECGEYPFTNGKRVEGPKAHRSVFDYLSRNSIDIICSITNRIYLNK